MINTPRASPPTFPHVRNAGLASRPVPVEELFAAPSEVAGHPAVRAATRLGAQLLAPHAPAADDPRVGVDPAHLARLAEAGLMSVTVPVELGRLGASDRVDAEVVELVSASCAATWFVMTQHRLPASLMHVPLADRPADGAEVGPGAAAVPGCGVPRRVPRRHCDRAPPPPRLTGDPRRADRGGWAPADRPDGLVHRLGPDRRRADRRVHPRRPVRVCAAAGRGAAGSARRPAAAVGRDGRHPDRRPGAGRAHGGRRGGAAHRARTELARARPTPHREPHLGHPRTAARRAARAGAARRAAGPPGRRCAGRAGGPAARTGIPPAHPGSGCGAVGRTPRTARRADRAVGARHARPDQRAFGERAAAVQSRAAMGPGGGVPPGAGADGLAGLCPAMSSPGVRQARQDDQKVPAADPQRRRARPVQRVSFTLHLLARFRWWGW